MPDIIISQFDRKFPLPIETFRQVQTIPLRNAIPTNIRWEGMLVYVITEGVTYALVGGVANTNWVNAGETLNVTVENVLTSNSTTNALSANMGKVLNEKFPDYQLLSEKGAANGYAPLGADSKISATYLPAYVDDVVEYANLAAFPDPGDTGKLYVALDTNFIYRWSGSVYIQIGGGGAGAVDSVFGRVGAITAQVGDYSSFYVLKTGDTMTGKLLVNAGLSGNFIADFENTDNGTSSNGIIVRVKNTSSNNTIQRWIANNVEVARMGANSVFTMNGSIVSDIFSGSGAQPFRLYGTGTENSNVGYYSIYESNGSIRQGYVGFPSGSNSNMIMFNDRASSYIGLGGSGGINDLIYFQGGNTNIVWHSGNDGPGSGMNADLLDGLNAGSFIRTDSSSTVGNFTTTLEGALSWRVSSADSAHQRADARDLGGESKLHWFGVNTSGTALAARHAFFNGSSYIDFTSISGGIQIGGNVTASNFILSSDKRMKKHIRNLTAKRIDVQWKKFKRIESGENQVGVIAQELKKTHPEFVIEDEKGFFSVKYIDLIITKLAELEERIFQLEHN